MLKAYITGTCDECGKDVGDESYNILCSDCFEQQVLIDKIIEERRRAKLSIPTDQMIVDFCDMLLSSINYREV